MVVQCLRCQAKFNLPEEKISPKGAKVKCSKCALVFTVPHPNDKSSALGIPAQGSTKSPLPGKMPSPSPSPPPRTPPLERVSIRAKSETKSPQADNQRSTLCFGSLSLKKEAPEPKAAQTIERPSGNVEGKAKAQDNQQRKCERTKDVTVSTEPSTGAEEKAAPNRLKLNGNINSTTPPRQPLKGPSPKFSRSEETEEEPAQPEKGFPQPPAPAKASAEAAETNAIDSAHHIPGAEATGASVADADNRDDSMVDLTAGDDDVDDLFKDLNHSEIQDRVESSSSSSNCSDTNDDSMVDLTAGDDDVQMVIVSNSDRLDSSDSALESAHSNSSHEPEMEVIASIADMDLDDIGGGQSQRQHDRDDALELDIPGSAGDCDLFELSKAYDSSGQTQTPSTANPKSRPKQEQGEQTKSPSSISMGEVPQRAGNMELEEIIPTRSDPQLVRTARPTPSPQLPTQESPKESSKSPESQPFWENRGNEKSKKTGLAFVLLVFVLLVNSFFVWVFYRNDWQVDFRYFSDTMAVAFGKERPNLPKHDSGTVLVKDLKSMVYTNATNEPLLVLDGKIVNRSRKESKGVHLEARLILDDEIVTRRAFTPAIQFTTAEMDHMVSSEAMDEIYREKNENNRSLVLPSGSTMPFMVVLQHPKQPDQGLKYEVVLLDNPSP